MDSDFTGGISPHISSVMRSNSAMLFIVCTSAHPLIKSFIFNFSDFSRLVVSAFLDTKDQNQNLTNEAGVLKLKLKLKWRGGIISVRH